MEAYVDCFAKVLLKVGCYTDICGICQDCFLWHHYDTFAFRIRRTLIILMEQSKTTAMESYVGYHGTNSANVQSIAKIGFRPSASYNEWLGFGVYFFIEGAFSPVSNAREWGKNNAWDNKNQRNKYTDFSILKVPVSGSVVFDLRKQDDLTTFDEARSHVTDRYLEERKNATISLKLEADTFICNAASKSLELDILIQNLYIKTKVQRVNRVHSRIPNTTVMCAKETAIINVAEMEEIEKSGVCDE